MLVALPTAFLVSLVLLWLYLRAVKRSMLRRATAEPSAELGPSAYDAAAESVGPPERPLHVETLDAATIPGQWTVTSRIWLAGVTHAVAGLAFAYVSATAFLLANGPGFDWQVALTGAMIFTWPIVITLGLVCTLSWLGVGLLVLGYALVLAATIAVLTAGTTITAGQVALLWFTLNKEGTLLVFALLARPIRAVGPLVAVLMIAFVAGAIYILFAVYDSDTALRVVSEIYTRLHIGVYGTIALILLAGAIPLRGFTKEARGCIYEINELLDTVPLGRIVFVIDRTTDEIGLVRVLFDGWARLGAASPNRADLTPHVCLVRFGGLYGRNIANLVALLAATAVNTSSHRMRLWPTLPDLMRVCPERSPGIA